MAKAAGERCSASIFKGGADAWFWIYVAQAIVFTALAILAFRRLALVAERGGAVGDQRSLPDPIG